MGHPIFENQNSYEPWTDGMEASNNQNSCESWADGMEPRTDSMGHQWAPNILKSELLRTLD